VFEGSGCCFETVERVTGFGFCVVPTLRRRPFSSFSPRQKGVLAFSIVFKRFLEFVFSGFMSCRWQNGSTDSNDWFGHGLESQSRRQSAHHTTRTTDGSALHTKND
jgi:hypothetical protein